MKMQRLKYNCDLFFQTAYKKRTDVDKLSVLSLRPPEGHIASTWAINSPATLLALVTYKPSPISISIMVRLTHLNIYAEHKDVNSLHVYLKVYKIDLYCQPF